MNKEMYTGRGIKIPDQHVVVLDKTPFIKFPGLVKLGHDTAEEMNGRLTQTEYQIVQIPSRENESVAIILVEMSVKSKDTGDILCSFHGIGDASPRSVDARVTPHIIRMAETRAMARALRVLTDVGMTAIEELDSRPHYEDQAQHDPYSPPDKKLTQPEEQPKQKIEEKKSEHKEEKSPKRLELEKDLKRVKSEKGFSNASLIKSINVILKKNIKGISEVTDEEIEKVINQLTNNNKVEIPVHTESPPEQEKVKDNPTDRASLMKDIKDYSHKAGMSPASVKILAMDMFDKPKDFKSSELTDEELSKLVDALKEKVK